MVPQWTDVLQAVGEIGSFITSIGGFAFIWWQLREFKQGLQSETNSKLYTEDIHIVNIFVENPELRRYFYDKVKITPDSPDFEKVKSIAELYLSHFEHVMLQLDNLPHHIRKNWVNYMRSLYHTSPVIRQYFNIWMKKGWFLPRMTKFMKKVSSKNTVDTRIHLV